MKLLFLGDIIGRAGRDAVIDRLPRLRADLGLDFVVVNGENAAGGFGITAKICDALFAAGADVITTSNHVWDQRDILRHIDNELRLLRPANYPPGTPGRGSGIFEAGGGRKVFVINLIGRIFMDALDDPFAAARAAMAKISLGGSVQAAVVDMHGEATSEKTAMGVFLDGQVSVVVGSHSHVPTADVRILPGGTAYQTDTGMCGDYNSIIGMEPREPLRRFTRKIPGGRFSPALGEATVCGLYVETDETTGLARRTAPLRLGGQLAQTVPET